jgi:hypothetical protein
MADSMRDLMCSGEPIVFESGIEQLPGAHVTRSDGEGHDYGEHRSAIKVSYKKKPLVFQFVNKFLDFGDPSPAALFKIKICKLKEGASDSMNPDYFLLEIRLGSKVIYTRDPMEPAPSQADDQRKGGGVGIDNLKSGGMMVTILDIDALGSSLYIKVKTDRDTLLLSSDNKEFKDQYALLKGIAQKKGKAFLQCHYNTGGPVKGFSIITYVEKR